MTAGADRVRLDVWLDVACVFKTRSEARRACNGGKVDVNGLRAKPHRDIRVGDRLTVTLGPGRRRVLIVAGLVETHVAKAMARGLYEDLTPAPSPEELELRDLIRRARSAPGARGSTFPVPRPSNKDRRTLRRIKQRGG